MLLFAIVSLSCFGAAPAPAEESGPPTAASAQNKAYGVATDHRLATEAAEAMLETGGNAVDAAVAASFVLSVTRPFACGIGGGGFMVIYLPGRAGPIERAINYREMCPAGISAETFGKAGLPPHSSEFGGLAVAVPGTVGGLLYTLEKYGTLPREVVLAPAIKAASDGFDIDATYAASAAQSTSLFEKNPAYKDRFPFVWNKLLGRGTVRVGERITNKSQAVALKKIAEQGTAVFYHGEIAQAIVSSVKATGGVLTIDDLARQAVSDTVPLRGEGFGRRFLTMPPPSSGGVALLQIMSLVERQHIVTTDLKSVHPGYLKLLVESMKFAFADRAFYMADPAFVPVPTAKLLSDEYLAGRTKIMPARRTMHPEFYSIDENGEQLVEDGGTSHISVVDGQGGAVACTETINLTFGSLVEVNGFGFILNNQMDDFTTTMAPNAFGLVQSQRNAPLPSKRPLSSMTPTLVLKADKIEMVAGGAGGPRIITATAQVVLNRVLFGMTAREAVAAPRVHHQWKPSELLVEDRLIERYNGLPISIWMEKFGHSVKRIPATAGVNAVVVTERVVEAAADDRRGGTATPHFDLKQLQDNPKYTK